MAWDEPKVKVFHIRSDNVFHLDDYFLAPFTKKQPNWGYGGLSYFVYKRTYARPLTIFQHQKRVMFDVENSVIQDSTERLGGPSFDGTEEFWETLQRVVEGTYSILCQQVRSYHQVWDADRAQQDAQEMFVRMWEFKFLPPGRGLWAMGTHALEMKGGAILNNCGFVSTETLSKNFSEPFCALMDLLMLGVGMGFDTRGANTIRINDRINVNEAWEYVIPDDREGWVNALRIVLDTFTLGGSLPARFNYESIRAKGSPLATFAGTASGPEPLRQLINATITHLLNRRGKFFTSTDIVDLANRIGVCVVAGNIRRSAEIAIGSPDDQDFINLKDPAELRELQKIESDTHKSFEARAEAQRKIDLHPLNTHRWASNNSLLCKVGQQNYTALAHKTVENGEPGYAWIDTIQTRGRLKDPPDTKDSKAKGFNPCAEQVLWDNELCCLVETFPTNHHTLEDYKRTLKFAYLYAKVVTCIPTHRPATNAVMNRNRRIGTSMAGVFEMIETLGMAEATRWWDEGYAYIRELDQDYSGWMGVPESIRVTSIKPGGTVPLLAGVEGGMKVPIANFYFRTVRVSDDSSYLPRLREAGYRIEPAKHESNTVVVYFPVASKKDLRSTDKVSLWEQACIAASLQRYWSDNMVSCTLNFKPNEAPDVVRILNFFETQLKAVSFLPVESHGYEQAPYIPISAEAYKNAVVQLKPLDLSDNKLSHEETDRFCSGDKCEVQS